MENLLISFNVVAPLFLLLAVGILLRKLGMKPLWKYTNAVGAIWAPRCPC